MDDFGAKNRRFVGHGRCSSRSLAVAAAAVLLLLRADERVAVRVRVHGVRAAARRL